METNVKSKTACSIRLLFLLVLLSGSLHVAGQISVADSSRSVAQATPPKIRYSYDTSGNRTDREIELASSSALRSDEEIVIQKKITLDDKIEAAISIYPNPTDGRFAVKTGDIPDGTLVEIYLYDMKGRLLEKKTSLKEGKTDFDLSRETTGIYILNINIGGKISTWKVIKK